MYRVELKEGIQLSLYLLYLHVPIVPCGVERLPGRAEVPPGCGFLMYRVELKDVVFGCFKHFYTYAGS